MDQEEPVNEGQAEQTGRPPTRLSTPSFRRRPTVRAVILLAAIAVVVTSAWFLAKPERTSRPGEGRTIQPSSSIPAPSPNTGATATSPQDFERVYTELEATRARAYQEHKPELLDEVYGPDCTPGCAVENQKKVIREMADAGAHFSDLASRLLEVQVVGAFDGAVLESQPRKLVTIRVIDQQDPFYVINADGSKGYTNPGWKPKRRVVELYFSPTKRHWMISDHVVEGPVEEFPTSPAPTGDN